MVTRLITKLIHIIGDLIKKIRSRLFSPATQFERKILNFIFKIFNFIFLRTNFFRKNQGLLIWDIRSNSITYDLIYLLFETKKFFDNYYLRNFDVLIFHPIDYSTKLPNIENYKKFINTQDLSNRVKDLILPILYSTKNVKNVYYSKSYLETIKIFSNYNFILPKIYNPYFYSPNPQDYKKLFKHFNSLSCRNIYTSCPLDIANTYPKEKKFSELYATFTLRDYGFGKERNTNLQDIKNFLLFCKLNFYKPIIIPDDLKKIDFYNKNFKNLHFFIPARQNFMERVFIYKHSKVNFFSPSGPASLSIFMPLTKTIIFNFCIGGKDCNKKYYKKELGLDFGDQPFLTFGGYLIWSNKSERSTINEFLKAYSKIKEYLENSISR